MASCRHRFRHGWSGCRIRRATCVKIGLSGKFLPFKYYGATGNQQAYGYKEE